MSQRFEFTFHVEAEVTRPESDSKKEEKEWQQD